MANPHNRIWNDERVEQLKRLHAGGRSCSFIAAKLGCGLSRNSIIGKLRRIGLGSIKPVETKETPTPRGRRRRLRPAASLFPLAKCTMEQGRPSSSPLNDGEIPFTQRSSLLELGQHDCRWSCGDPDASDFFFCGAPVVDGLPYCRAHCERAYQLSRMASATPRWRIRLPAQGLPAPLTL
jgi:GcrA cell cycle regulator